MKTAEEILENSANNLGYSDAYNMFWICSDNDEVEVVNQTVLSCMQTYAEQFKPKWISVEERLPEYSKKVIVARPNNLF